MRIPPQLARNTPNCLNCCSSVVFNYNYLLCDMSRIIYTSFRQIIYNKPAYSWPEGINT